MTKIKICGLTREEDIRVVNEFLPDYIGFVFAPSRRQVTVEQAKALREKLAPAICPVGVFVSESAEVIEQIVKQGIIKAVQLHGQETPEQAAHIKELLAPWHIPVIKAIRMDSAAALNPWVDSAVDYLLLDAGAGGTGSQFDHSLLEAVLPIRKPWFLAGGMTPENAAEAICRFVPYGIDVSSGVETAGVKDKAKIEKMIRLFKI